MRAVPGTDILMRVLIRLFIFLLVVNFLVAGAAGAGYFWLLWQADQPGPLQGERVILIERGAGVSSISSELEATGVVTDRRIFRALARVTESERSLKAGEYRFPAQISMAGVIEKLERGDVVLHTITIAEGLSVAQVMDILSSSELLSGELNSVPDEGSLLPETYSVIRGDDREGLVTRMQAAQQDLLDELWPNRAPNLPFNTREEAIILASVVEKETAIPDERARVAAVFVNRMRKGMRLETDPTIIYGLTGGYPLGRGLRRSELNDDKNLFNTYRHDGLPPTAIANPGRDSIRAVLNPITSDDLFFVADGTGGHIFARTYAEHRRNVAQWRQIEARRGSQ
jgi:UPF0755 protein